MFPFLRDFVRWFYHQLHYRMVRVVCLAAGTEKTPGSLDLLLVRNDLLGDFVCSLPMMEALSRHVRRRGGRMVIVVAPALGDFARCLGLFDEVLEWRQTQSHSLRHYIAMRRKLRCSLSAYRFREAVLGITAAHIPPDDLIMSAVAAHERICGVLPGNAGGLPVHPFPPYQRVYCYQRALSVQQNDLAFYEFITGEKPQLRPAPEYMPRLAAAELAALPVIPPRCLALVPGASRAFRCWPPERFAAVAQWWMAENPGNAIAILGNDREQKLAQDIIAALPAETARRVTDLTGRTTLLQLSALLPQFTAVVSNETGTAHFAMRLGVPVVSILGGGHYGVCEPNPLYSCEYCVTVSDRRCFNCNWRCRYSRDETRPFPCIDGIPVNAVTASLRRLLQERNLPAAVK